MYAITFTTPGFMMYRVLYNFLVLNPCDQSRLIYLWSIYNTYIKYYLFTLYIIVLRMHAEPSTTPVCLGT